MMKKFRGAAAKLILGFLWAGLLLAVGGCGLWTKKEPEKTPQSQYNDAVRLLEKKKYTDAAEAFKRFKEDYPLSTYTPLAELRTADALYYDKNYAEAIVLYEEFRKLHPVHAEIPYVTYQVGMCHFQQMLSVDRDQTVAEKALEQFRYLKENFPQTKYASEANTKMQQCLFRLAEHEFYVGHFYYRMKHYRGALGRFEELLKKYPGTGMEPRVNPLIKDCRERIDRENDQKKEKEKKEKGKKTPDLQWGS